MTVAAVLAAAAFVCVIFVFDPLTSGIYPRCPSKLLTGFDCPGCGSTRALHALLHLRWAGAWRYNAAVFFALPLMALYLVGPRLPRRNVLNRLAHDPRLSWAVVAAVVLWTVLRNIFLPLD